MLKFAMTKAGQLGLEVSVNLSSCAGALKGPWQSVTMRRRNSSGPPAK